MRESNRIREGAVEERDDEEVQRPGRAEHPRLRLHPGEIRRREERAEEEDVVEGRVRRAPTRPTRTAADRRHAHARHAPDARPTAPAIADGTDPVHVLLQEEADARDEEEDAEVERGADLRADGHELAARDAPGPRRLFLGQDAVGAQRGDGVGDLGTRAHW